MYASHRFGRHLPVLVAILASAAACGAVIAAWQESVADRPSGGIVEVARPPVSAVLESSEWGNTRSFWSSGPKGGASFSGGFSGSGTPGYRRGSGDVGGYSGNATASGGSNSGQRSNLGAGLGALDTANTPRNGQAWSAGVGRSGVYRTVCVRLCDGFYFPIKAATTSATFAEDEEACRSSCAAPARLFVYPTDTGSPEEMTDTAGRPYAKLPTAFLYRTTYDAACTCRPQAWETAATDRHRLYAAEAAAARLKSASQRKQALAALDPLRKRIAETERLSRKAAEAKDKAVVAALARIEAPGLVHRASQSAGTAGGWSPAGWSDGRREAPEGMMRLGGPRPSAGRAKRRSSHAGRRRR